MIRLLRISSDHCPLLLDRPRHIGRRLSRSTAARRVRGGEHLVSGLLLLREGGGAGATAAVRVGSRRSEPLQRLIEAGSGLDGALVPGASVGGEVALLGEARVHVPGGGATGGGGKPRGGAVVVERRDVDLAALGRSQVVTGRFVTAKQEKKVLTSSLRFCKCAVSS